MKWQKSALYGKVKIAKGNKAKMSRPKFQVPQYMRSATLKMRSPWCLKFVQNSIACCKPGVDITVEDQLFPTKARCSFIQYIASKPDKFGIKFCLTADVGTKCMLNGPPYLAKEETQRPGQRLGDSGIENG